jgi:hypothetical protein
LPCVSTSIRQPVVTTKSATRLPKGQPEPIYHVAQLHHPNDVLTRIRVLNLIQNPCSLCRPREVDTIRPAARLTYVRQRECANATTAAGDAVRVN